MIIKYNFNWKGITYISAMDIYFRLQKHEFTWTVYILVSSIRIRNRRRQIEHLSDIQSTLNTSTDRAL